MELISNLVWVVVSLVLLAMTYRAVRRGSVKLPMASAMTLALLICFILLPVISVSDDLLEARQATLPLAAQTWRMASEGVSSGLDKVLILSLYLLLLISFADETQSTDENQWDVRPLAGRLARSQRLRPPPSTL